MVIYKRHTPSCTPSCTPSLNILESREDAKRSLTPRQTAYAVAANMWRFKPTKSPADSPPTSLPPSPRLAATPDSSPCVSGSASPRTPSRNDGPRISRPGWDTRSVSGPSLPPPDLHIGATAQTSKSPPIRRPMSRSLLSPMARRSLSHEWSGLSAVAVSLSAPAQPPAGAPDDLGGELTTPPAMSQREAPWAPRIDSARNLACRRRRSALPVEMPDLSSS